MTFDEMILSSPKKPGVYKMYDAGGNLLYVGKAKDLSKRLKQYRDGEKLEYNKIIMRRQVARVEWLETESESAALVLEQGLIKSEKPKYNIVLKDDKMYPFLALSSGPFPRLYKFRSKMARQDRNIFGPFPFVSDLNDTIKLVQKACQVRTCSDNVFNAHRKRPCLLAQTGRCMAPCAAMCSADFDKQYKYGVKLAKRILSGHTRRVLSDLDKKMKAAAALQDFEEAAKIREQIQALQSTCAPAPQVAKIGK